MATNFPNSLDVFTDPNAGAGDTLATVPHDVQHASANDAITALEVKVGVNNSLVATTIDNKFSTHTTSNPNAHHNQAHTFADHTDVTRSKFITSDNLNGVNVSATTVGSGDAAVRVLALRDGAFTDGARVVWIVPEDFVSGFTIKPVWAAATTDASAHTVRWQLSYLQLSEGISEVAASTVETWTGDSAARTQDLVHIESGHAPASQPTGAPCLWRITLERLGNDGADTYVGVVNLLGIQINYVANQ